MFDFKFKKQTGLIEKIMKFTLDVFENKMFGEFAPKCQQKLMDHTWYISERLVAFSLFSEKTTIMEKQNIRKALLRCSAENATPFMCLPSFDVNHCDTLQLQDFVGPDTWTFLYLLDPSRSNNNSFSFLNHHPSNWNQMENYTTLLNVAKDLPVVNDAAERALGLVTEFRRSSCPKTEEQKQYLFKVVKELRSQQLQQATSSERVTKASFSQNMLEWG